MFFPNAEEFIAACKENKVRIVASTCVIDMRKRADGTWQAWHMDISITQIVKNIPSTPTEEAEYGK